MGGKLAKPKIDNAGPTSAHSFTTSPVETVGPKSHTAFGRTPLRHAKLPLPNDLRVPAVLSISEGHASNPSASSPAPLKPSPVFRSFLQQVHRAFARVNTGEVASYIPELKKANPDDFGICVVTMDGVVYEVGDSDVPFTIQSASKPFAYCLALEDNSLETVLSKVGVEPTGQAFNVLSVDSKGRPRNPLINAGAIATSSLVKGATPAAQFEGIRRRFSDFAGHPLPLDTAVFRSEHATGHRNRGFGHMLKQAGVIEGDVDAACDIYFKQCSIQVTARDLVCGCACGWVVCTAQHHIKFAVSAQRMTLLIHAACVGGAPLPGNHGRHPCQWRSQSHFWSTCRFIRGCAPRVGCDVHVRNV